MTAQDLKNAILQLAVRGKLVPQDPADEPASELLKRIQAEKSQLVKEDNRKKGTPIQPISVDEIPFDIPESWAWVRFSNLMLSFSTGPFGTMLHKSDYVQDGIPLVNPANIVGKDIILSKKMMVSADAAERLNAYRLESGMLVMGRRGEMGRCAVVSERQAGWVCGTGSFFMRPAISLCIDYLLIFFSTSYAKKYLEGESVGSTMNNLNHKILMSIPVPLPPFAEQTRIATKIEELLPYIEEYDAAEKRMTALNKKFPDQLRKSILQQAIKGKLTERDPADEPASELLKRIQAEKSRLVKEGKLKKEKPLPTLTEDDYPFDIPDEWEWVRLTDVGEVSRGRSKNRPRNDPSLFERGIYPFIQTGDVAQSAGTILECHSFYNEKGLSQSRMWPKGTLCLTIAANIGDVGILNFDACFPDSVIGFNAFHPIKSNKYFLYVLMAYKAVLDSRATKSAQKNINLDTLASLAYPLPPLAEQQRIVERVEELLAVCGQLK